jgi:hypothetical protein
MEFIGAKSAIDILTDTTILPTSEQTLFKKEALMFNRIAVPLLASILPVIRSINPESISLITEIEWLLEQGIVFEPNTAEINMAGKNNEAEIYRLLEHNYMKPVNTYFKSGEFDSVQRFNDSEPDQVIKEIGLDAYIEKRKQVLGHWMCLVNAGQYYTRRICIQLQEANGLNVTPIFSRNLDVPAALNKKKNEVIEIILSALPMPDESTAWEQIIEYRSDPDSYKKFLSLRSWVSEVARMELKPNEVEEKLISLINDYQNHMKTHKIKTRLDTLKTIVIAEVGFITGGWFTGLGALSGIVGMVVAPLYSIKQRQISLMEEEQKAPGKEVAYIIKAKETFK